MSRHARLFIGVILVFIGVAGLALSGPIQLRRKTMGTGDMMGGGAMMDGTGGMMKNMGEIERKTWFASAGDKDLFQGNESKGEFIKNSHGMQGAGCAMCHGANAQGMRMMMMDVPPPTWSYLSDPKGHIHPNGRKHPPFTESSFKSCVLAGIDPAGNELSSMMPKWQISDEDLDSLIEYLKTK